MSEDSATPDLVEVWRHANEVLNEGDLDAAIEFYAADAVLDTTRTLGSVDRGREAIRGKYEEWFAAYEELKVGVEELVDIGNGVAFAVLHQKGRLLGATGYLEQREGVIGIFSDGLVTSLVFYRDIDEGRAVAERLAEKRESAMSQENVDLVRRAVAALNARDLDGYLACCTEDVALHTPLEAFVGVYERRDGIRQWLVDVEDAAPDFRIDLQDVKAVGSDQVLAFAHLGTTGRASGVPLAGDSGNVYDLVDGKIRRTRIFLDRADALKAVGLEE